MTIMFDESKHRRKADGTFTTKGFAAEDDVSFSDDTGRATLTETSVIKLPLAESHPHLPSEVQRRHSDCRVLTVERDGREEAYLVPNQALAERERAHRSTTARAERRRLTFGDEELAQFDPAPLQMPVGQPAPRLRDLDITRIPRNRRAAVREELDRPVGWLPHAADGSAGTIRNEIEAGHITGKKADSGGQYFIRTSVPEGSSQVSEDSSHKAIGVSTSLYNCLNEQ